MLSKKQILECNDIKSEIVQVPEWNGEVLVQGLTLDEKDAYRDSLRTDGEVNLNGATARFCAFCMVDEDGSRLFNGADVELLGQRSSVAMDRVFQVAQRLSAMGEYEIKEAVKNSEKTQTDDSD